MKRAQFAMEFIMLFIMSVFIFLLILGISGSYMEESRIRSEQKKLELFADSIKNEIELAKYSETEFELEVMIPLEIEGTKFSAVIEPKDILVINHLTLDITIIKKIPEIDATMTLTPGQTYKIKKTDTGVIKIEV